MRLGNNSRLATIRSLLEDAVSGRPGVALIEGPPGVGKTRLVAEAKPLAVATGLRVFSAQGRMLEREFAFGAVRQMFEARLREELSGR